MPVSRCTVAASTYVHEPVAVAALGVAAALAAPDGVGDCVATVLEDPQAASVRAPTTRTTLRLRRFTRSPIAFQNPSSGVWAHRADRIHDHEQAFCSVTMINMIRRQDRDLEPRNRTKRPDHRPHRRESPGRRGR